MNLLGPKGKVVKIPSAQNSRSSSRDLATSKMQGDVHSWTRRTRERRPVKREGWQKSSPPLKKHRQKLTHEKKGVAGGCGEGERSLIITWLGHGITCQDAPGCHPDSSCHQLMSISPRTLDHDLLGVCRAAQLDFDWQRVPFVLEAHMEFLNMIDEFAILRLQAEI